MALNLHAAVTFTVLHTFTNTDGATPEAALIQGADGNFYGTTTDGGTNDEGTVFVINASGTFTNLYSFTGGSDGAAPEAALVEGDGFFSVNFYGTTFTGGTNYLGTVFEITGSGRFTTLYTYAGQLDGQSPEAALVLGPDGYFYGTTFYGGQQFGGPLVRPNLHLPGPGTVFKIAPRGGPSTYSQLYDFTNSDGANGGFPHGALVAGGGGTFYGTTTAEGAYGYGTVFRITSSGALTTLYSFAGGDDGSHPDAGLVQGSDGNFYGTTSGGGANYSGTIFKITPGGTLTTLYTFTGGDDGGSPEAALIQANDGNFYGTASEGGTNDWGTVFEMTPSGAFTLLYSFTGTSDGLMPEAALVQGSDGNFYGTTAGYDDSTSYGSVFKLSVGLPPLSTPTVQAAAIAGGVFTFEVSGPAGSNVVIQSSSDFKNWTPLQTNTVGSGPIYFPAPDIPAYLPFPVLGPQLFYRAVVP